MLVKLAVKFDTFCQRAKQSNYWQDSIVEHSNLRWRVALCQGPTFQKVEDCMCVCRYLLYVWAKPLTWNASYRTALGMCCIDGDKGRHWIISVLFPENTQYRNIWSTVALWALIEPGNSISKNSIFKATEMCSVSILI